MIPFRCVLLFLSAFIHKCDVSLDMSTNFGLKFVIAFNKIPNTEPYLILHTNESKVALLFLKVEISRSEPISGHLINWMVSRVTRQDVTIVQLESAEIPFPQKDVGPHGCFVLQSATQFGIHVVLFGLDRTLASYLALPLMAWGRRYHLVTLHLKMYVTFISEDETIVKFKLHSIPSYINHQLFEDKISSKNNLFVVWLRNFEAFTISTCFLNNTIPDFSFTGSFVESQSPIGVVTGTCSYVMSNEMCSRMKDHPDISAEMLYPQYTFGTTFVVMTIVDRKTRGIVVATSTQPYTNISVFMNLRPNDNYLLKEAGTFQYLETVDEKDMVVLSSKPIMLSLIVTSSCQDSLDHGGPSIATIIPLNLLCRVCIWRTLPFPNTSHYLALTTFNPESANFRINNMPLSVKGFCRTHPLLVSNTVVIYTCSLPTYHYVIVESTREFACYFYGLGFGAYFSSGGFQIKEGRKLECVNTQPTAGDRIDNDCDSRVDEEIIDLQDNDGDGLCDEDFQATETYEAFTWGPNCLQNCSGCQHACSPIDGYCDTCRPGYKGHLSGCQFKCEEYEYGVNCNGNCYEKCGEDCVNRENGQCSEIQRISFYHHGLLYLGVLVVLAVFYHCLCHSRKKTNRSSETEMGSNITKSFKSREL